MSWCQLVIISAILDSIICSTDLIFKIYTKNTTIHCSNGERDEDMGSYSFLFNLIFLHQSRNIMKQLVILQCIYTVLCWAWSDPNPLHPQIRVTGTVTFVDNTMESWETDALNGFMCHNRTVLERNTLHVDVAPNVALNASSVPFHDSCGIPQVWTVIIIIIIIISIIIIMLPLNHKNTSVCFPH